MAKKKKEEEQQPEEKKKGGALKWIIILLLLLGLAGGGAFAYFKYIEPMMKKGGDEGEKQEEVEKKEDKDKKDKKEKPAISDIISLPPQIVNLADPLGRRYLKVGIDVEVNTLEGAGKLQEHMAQIKDSLLLLLSSKTYKDLEGIANKLVLKKEIVERLNQVVNDVFVVNVYFTEFVIQ